MPNFIFFALSISGKLVKVADYGRQLSPRNTNPKEGSRRALKFFQVVGCLPFVDIQNTTALNNKLLQTCTDIMHHNADVFVCIVPGGSNACISFTTHFLFNPNRMNSLFFFSPGWTLHLFDHGRSKWEFIKYSTKP